MTVKNCEKMEKSQVVLTIEVDAKEFDAAVEKAYQKNRRKIRVPGFRPGKAPRKMIETMYGPEVFYNDAINAAAPEAYNAAIQEQDLRVVSMPDFEMEEDATKDGFTFKATVQVYPEVTLGQYKGLSAPRPGDTVSEEDVDRRMQALADRNSRLVSVDRPAEMGDTVIFDFDGYMDGKPFEGGKAENHTLELGSGAFIPGFEEQMVGLSAGDDGEVNVTFPTDYAPELAGKDAVFKLKIHEIKKRDVPELDDEFVKDVSEFDTIQELRDDLRRQIQEEHTRAADRAFEDALMDQVADNITVEIPEAMIEGQIQQIMMNLQNQMYQQGMTYETYQKMTGSTDAGLRESAREPAEKQVRIDLAINAIVKAENLEATEEDVEKEYEQLADDSGMDVESVKKYFTEDRVKEQVLTQKALKIVSDSATATEYVPPAAPETAENAEAAPDNGGEG